MSWNNIHDRTRLQYRFVGSTFILDKVMLFPFVISKYSENCPMKIIAALRINQTPVLPSETFPAMS